LLYVFFYEWELAALNFYRKIMKEKKSKISQGLLKSINISFSVFLPYHFPHSLFLYGLMAQNSDSKWNPKICVLDTRLASGQGVSSVVGISNLISNRAHLSMVSNFINSSLLLLFTGL
jgi:hypothetical protein